MMLKQKKFLAVSLSLAIVYILTGCFFYLNSSLVELVATLWPFVIVSVFVTTGLPFLAYRITSKKNPPTFVIILVVSLLMFLLIICGFESSKIYERLSYTANSFLILLVSIASGRLVFDLLKINLEKAYERVFLSTIAGFGFFSIAILLTGIFYKTGRNTVWAIIIFGIIASAKSFRNQIKDIREIINKCKSSISFREIVLAFILIISCLATLPISFIPPMDYDVTEYHAELPRRYLYEKKISFDKYNMFSGMPQNMEMLSLASFSLSPGKDHWITAKITHWFFMPLLMVMLAMTARKSGAGGYSYLAPLLILSAPLSFYLATKLYVETGMCVFGLATFYFCLIAFEKENFRYFLICGLFAGFASGIKYPALIFFCFPVFLIILTHSKNLRNNIKNSALFIAGIFIAFSPWLIKNLLETGNPVYPIFNNILHIESWTPVLAERFRLAHNATDFSISAHLDFLYKTFLASGQLLPAAFILMILFIPLLNKKIFLSEDSENKIYFPYYKLFCWLIFIIGGWFYLTHRLERFLQPAYIIAAICAAVGLAQLKNQIHKILLNSAIIFMFLISSIIVIWSLYLKEDNFSKVAFGLENYESVLNKDPSYQTGKLFKSVKRNPKILALGDAAHYWFPYNVEMSIVFNTHPLEEALSCSKNVEQLEDWFKKSGYTHLYISWPELARLHATYYKAYDFSKDEQILLRKFLGKYVRKILPLYSGWPEFNAKYSLLPLELQNDFLKYKDTFNINNDFIYADSSYAKARPWIGAFADNGSYSTSQKQLIKLFKDYQILLSLSANGGPPPLCRAPYECLVFNNFAASRR